MKIEIGLRLANIRKKWWYYFQRWNRLRVMTTEWVQPQSEAICQRSRPSSAATSASLPIGWETIEQEAWECTSSSKQRGLSAFWTDSSRLHSLHFFFFLYVLSPSLCSHHLCSCPFCVLSRSFPLLFSTVVEKSVLKCLGPLNVQIHWIPEEPNVFLSRTSRIWVRTFT